MGIKLSFDSEYNPITPTIILATRSGRKIGTLPIFNLHLKETLNQPEISFSVNKYDNGVPFAYWDQIKDFKLAYCKEWDHWFELIVEIEEGSSTIKNITGLSLCEAELSQINLYNIEINTEDDIAREDYVPTVLYNPEHPNASLLNRIMDKLPHYTISHVDDSIANIQRTFSFDNKNFYDATQEIGEELNCLFKYGSNSNSDGSINRSISVYDLESYCYNCGNRGEFLDICPECGSNNIKHGYGKDTTVFVTTENLAENIVYSTDTGAVKNCFRLEGGDDLMTASIINCNPNGTAYLWYLSEDMKEDMSDELTTKLDDYNEMYEDYQTTHLFLLPNGKRTSYNVLVNKYSSYKDSLSTLSESIVGYPALMNSDYDAIDFELFLHDGLMPSVIISNTSASQELSKLMQYFSSVSTIVAVEPNTNPSVATVTNAVLSMAKIIVDSRYTVKASEESYNNRSNKWSGKFTVTSFYDETQTATGATVEITIGEDLQEFLEQKIDKALSKKIDEVTNIVDLFKSDNFASDIKKYSLTALRAIYDSCQSSLEILIEQGIGDDETWADKIPNLYEVLYSPLYAKLGIIESEIILRETEIETINSIHSFINDTRAEIQTALDFEQYLGTQLWHEFCAYRREDTYKNENYISDGLSNAELFANALEFYEIAQKEIYKSANLQHSISSTLKNLLIMKEFSPIVADFEIGNWIRIQSDDNVYRIRLIEYDVDFTNPSNLSVEFSDITKTQNGTTDVKSILGQAASMATSYDSVKRQSSQGQQSKKRLDNWVNDGLALTNMKIVSDASNQNVTYDSHGILCREYNSMTGKYDDRQLKIINRGLYVTDDGWETSKAGIGDFTYYDPESKEWKDAYGVIADTIVGRIILGQKVGIYNSDGDIKINENGIEITSDGTSSGANTMNFAIYRKIINSSGEEQKVPVFYVDSNGELVLNGNVNISSSTSTDASTLEDLMNQINATIASIDVVYIKTDSATVTPSKNDNGWSSQAPTWESGKYIWQMAITTYTNGATSKGTPTCITGANGEQGIPGTPGDDGADVINEIPLEYLAITGFTPTVPTTRVTSTSTETGVWTTASPEWKGESYRLWTCIENWYSDGRTTWSTPKLANALNNANDVAADAKNTADASWEIVDTELVKKDGEVYAAVNQIRGDITGIEADVSALRVNTDGINAKVSNLQVGGNQILRGTNVGFNISSSGEWSQNKWRAASSGTGTRTVIDVSNAPNANIKKGIELTQTSGALDIAQDNIPIQAGITYTLSCYAKGTGLLHLQYGHNNYVSEYFTLDNINEWARCKFTFTLGEKNDGSSSGLMNAYFGNSGNGTIQICGMKLEVGSIPSDWSMSDKETEERIASITITSDSILSEVSETYATKASVDGIQVGGTNLIRNTNTGSSIWAMTRQSGRYTIEDEEMLGVNGAKITISEASSSWSVVHTKNDDIVFASLLPSSQYVLSFDVYSSVAIPATNLGIRKTDGTAAITNIASIAAIQPNKWTKVSAFLTTTEAFPSDLSGHRVYWSPVNVVGIIQICNLKLESGNKATDWSAAPEDITIYIGSRLEQTKEGLNLTIDSLSDAYDKTKDQLDDIFGVDGQSGKYKTLTDQVNAAANSISDLEKDSLKKEDLGRELDTYIDNTAVKQVATTTGYKFDKDGLNISNSSSSISTVINNDGMRIKNDERITLVANNRGVYAENLRATTFLIIGHSRFENYPVDRTACFYTESEQVSI